MFPVNTGVESRFASRARTAILLLCALMLASQPGGYAQSSGRPPLKLFKNYFLAGGDYVVGGVGLRGQGDASGFATGSIPLSGVPGNADIAAAFLYWLSLEPNDTAPMSAAGAFRGQAISGKVIGPGVRVPGCWGSGGGAGTTSSTTQLRAYRADVLKNFAVSNDPATPGKLLVNGTHQVQLRDSGGGGTQAPASGNQVTYVEGASLVVVYRIAAEPLRAVVIHDGGATLDTDFPPMELNIGGYYDATVTASARMTHIVGDGGLRPETLSVNGQVVGGDNPFSGSLGSSWDNPTFTVPGTVSDTGVTTGVTFPSSSIDCLSWAAVLLSTPVQDTDGDGIPDKVENGTAVVGAGEPALPDFAAMGANPNVPDLFVELGFFQTLSASNAWSAASGVGPHDHRPTANALAMAGRAFKRAGITPHFDIGLDNAGDNRYPAALNPQAGSCANPATWTLGCAIVPDAHARGGEMISETACGLDPEAPCQFPNHPGTVGWKAGYQYFRDAPVAADGSQLSAAQESALEESCELSGVCPDRRRFDANRMDFFHYSLWAHALGLPKASCLNPDGSPDAVCEQTNPDFHVPVTSSGFGDVGGGDSLITLGAFGSNFNGADVAQAGTFMHELGHNFERRHGGEVFERNCKPNYISVMSYLFQVHGMDNGAAVDFSGQVLNSLDETALVDGPLTVTGSPGTLPSYATRWYAPLATSFIHNSLSVTPATKHCDGSLPLPGEPYMVRVDGTGAGDPVDWLNDGALSTSPIVPSSDVNFDGNLNPLAPTATPPNAALQGSDDWFHIKQTGLRQMGSRPNMGLTSLEMAFTDLGRGDPGRGDPGRGDPGRGDPGRGDPGRGDPGRGDPGRGDPGRGDPGAPPDQGDLTLDHANAIFNGPYSLTAQKVLKTVRLTWLPPVAVLPHVQIHSTTAYRIEGGAITPANWAKRVQVGQVFGTATTLVDSKPQTNKLVTYIVIVDFSDGTRSGISNPTSITYK
jgi:hypothetical protein